MVVNKHKGFVRFGLTHIIATNICIWALATITETAEDFRLQIEQEMTKSEELHNTSGMWPLFKKKSNRKKTDTVFSGKSNGATHKWEAFTCSLSCSLSRGQQMVIR